MNHSMFCHVSIRNVLHFAMLLGLRSALVQLSCLRWRDTSGQNSIHHNVITCLGVGLVLLYS